MRRYAFAALAALCLLLPSAANAKGYGLPWCGIYMSQYFGIHDRKLWLAANWRFEGSAAGGPCVGCVVVWPHHVGVIAGGPNDRGEWLVHSGNDGNAVRTRYRSLRGAIAFRHVGGSAGFAVGVGDGLSLHAHLEVEEHAPRRRHKHLVPLARERREARVLDKARAVAEPAHFELFAPSSFAIGAELTHKVVRHHRKAVAQR